MQLNKTWNVVGLMAGSIALGMMIGPVFVAAGDAGPSERAVAAQEGEGARVFELRVYTAAPGKMDALHKRFREHTLRLFAKHGIQSIGYWTADAGEGEAERLYYIVAYPDRESRERSLMRGIAVDPEFRRAVAESETAAGGKLTAGIESVMLTPTDYSPLR